jgi:polysaccharide biosynthesis protein PelA
MSRVSAHPPSNPSHSGPDPAGKPGVARARSVWALLVFSLLLPLAAAGADALPSVAFFYGGHPPLEVLRDFDWVVIQPDALGRPDSLASPHTLVFGYLSLGEVEKDSAAARALPAQCRLGENRLWNTWIVDQAQAACRAFYLEHVFGPLRARGYRNFFFDTLDSYRLVLQSTAESAAYRNGLITLIEAMHRADSGGSFILNRGFELLDALAGQGVIGVAAESLYQGWNPGTHDYGPVEPAATQQLLEELERVRKAGLTPIAIDYLSCAAGPAAERLAQRIASQGIVPYVSSAALDVVGVSTIAPLPRRVLVLYDGDAGNLTSDVNRYAAMPLNYLGYATQGIDVTRQPLPAGPLTGQVAGIVTWFHSDRLPQAAATWRWLRAQMKAGVPVVILGDWGMPASANDLEPLGLRLGAPPPAGLHAARIAHVERDYFGFESPVLPSAPDFSPLQLAKGTPLLDIEVAGATEVAAGLTPWGGYALAPYVLRNLPQGDLTDGENQAAWIIDPFRFFRAALHVPAAPVYDFTTTSGRRLLFTLIDGDGFSSGSWISAFRGEPAAEVILGQVLERFKLPATASVIASEFVEHGLNPPAEVEKLRPIARRIFGLPWVQIGTHTYSHPFDWPALEHDPNLSAGLHIESPPATSGASLAAGASVVRYRSTPGLQYGYNLPVPGYRFSAEMEVTGSTDIINRLLAPPGKRVRVIQWSGDTDPGAEVLGMAYADGLENINGINSTITRAHPSLTNVVPLGTWQGPYFQVYSPIADEDEYTHLWRPPYCGFDQVIQTMQMTDRPRRLAAMEIYYHYYSGARPCALKQLLQVYRWAQAQPAAPVFASTYSRIAVAFESAGLARAGNGFLARGYGADQELRIAAVQGYPDLGRSRNVAGYDDFDGRRYIHLGPGGEARLYLQAAPPRQPYLQSANGLIEALTRTPETLGLLLEAQVPLVFTLGNTRHCRTRIDGRDRPGRTDARGEVRFQLARHRAHVDIVCRG